MKFYKRFPGDIMKKTSGLSMAQMGAYDRLIDWCYANEQPIDPDEVFRITHAETAQDRRDVEKVLKKFFSLEADGYRHERIEEVIAEALPRIEAARANGKKGGRPLGSGKKPIGFSKETQDEPKSKTSQSQIKEGNSPQPPDGGRKASRPKSERASAVGLKAWLELLRERGEKPIPEGDAVFAYADRVGLPGEFLSLAWAQFKHRYAVQHPSKRYSDWRRVFRNAVEGNWLKLWWLDPSSDGYALTTVGQQAKRDHDGRAAA